MAVNRYQQCKEAVEFYGSKRAAAAGLGIARATLQGIIKTGDIQSAQKGFLIDKPPAALRPVEELIEQRKRQYAQRAKHEQGRRLINVTIGIDGPVGILHFGDPHVDDNGTDLSLLEQHTAIVNRTDGMFGANVGDTTNNWVGRLARLYGEQSTSAAEAWQLAEWFLNRVNWLYVIGGNHDCWSGAGDPVQWILKQQDALYQSSEVRLNLKFPNRREVRVNAHHDFPGHSMWNAAHGSSKAAQMGFRDHILINGHRHTSGYNKVKCPSTGIISHCLQVASYKIYDRYSREKGFRDQHISPCVVTIIDPYASEVSLVQVFDEPGEAAEFLTFKRRKFKRQK